jgi:hypothetical protein
MAWTVIEINRTAAASDSHYRQVVQDESAEHFELVAATMTLATMGTANAAGSVVGGVAGHYAGHHAVVGAVDGWVVRRHMAKKHPEAGCLPQGGTAPVRHVMSPALVTCACKLTFRFSVE